MIPKEIIELAITGGWDKKDGYHDTEWCWEVVVLNTTFWQALGKSCGWGHDDDGEAPVWYVKAMDFYDLILIGLPTDTFWQEIINANK